MGWWWWGIWVGIVLRDSDQEQLLFPPRSEEEKQSGLRAVGFSPLPRTYQALSQMHLIWLLTPREPPLPGLPHPSSEARRQVCLRLCSYTWPDGLAVKNLPANVGDTRDMGLIPGPGRRRKWQPTPVFLLEKSHGERSLLGHCLWGHKESDTSEFTHSYTCSLFSRGHT